MAKSVTSAFSEFLRDSVNLDSSDTQKARNSRDNLIGNLNSFSGHDGFFVIYDSKNLKFGSFARRTKIRPIDDIDIILCFSAEETRKYVETSSGIDIIASENDKQNGLLIDGINYLNSTKVINRCIKKLSELRDYSKAELHKKQEAAILKLKSYTWYFDIVPCFTQIQICN